MSNTLTCPDGIKSIRAKTGLDFDNLTVSCTDTEEPESYMEMKSGGGGGWKTPITCSRGFSSIKTTHQGGHYLRSIGGDCGDEFKNIIGNSVKSGSGVYDKVCAENEIISSITANIGGAIKKITDATCITDPQIAIDAAAVAEKEAAEKEAVEAAEAAEKEANTMMYLGIGGGIFALMIMIIIIKKSRG